MPGTDIAVRAAALLMLAALAAVEVRSVRQRREIAREVEGAATGDATAERRAGAWLEHEARRPLWLAVTLEWSAIVVKLAVLVLAVRALVQPSAILGWKL